MISAAVPDDGRIGIVLDAAMRAPIQQPVGASARRTRRGATSRARRSGSRRARCARSVVTAETPRPGPDGDGSCGTRVATASGDRRQRPAAAASARRFDRPRSSASANRAGRSGRVQCRLRNSAVVPPRPSQILPDDVVRFVRDREILRALEKRAWRAAPRQAGAAAGIDDELRADRGLECRPFIVIRRGTTPRNPTNATVVFVDERRKRRDRVSGLSRKTRVK